MSQAADFTEALSEPASTSPTGLVTGLSPTQRLSQAMRLANESSADYGIPAPGQRWSYSSAGVPNPYGAGIKAFEPNNALIDAYRQAKNESDASKAAEAAAAVPGAGLVPAQAADGKVGSFVNAAMALAQRHVPYVWGGITANGVDCSGLIYFAARSAGIQLNGKDWPRLRAIDYGQLGTAVSLQEARPGDLVYYDNPNTTTDHVGIYIGNGQVVQAPQTGDHVRVTSVGHATSIRRIFEDSSFGTVALVTGQVTSSYNGTAYNPGQNIGGPGQAASTITRAPGTGSNTTAGSGLATKRAI